MYITDINIIAQSAVRIKCIFYICYIKMFDLPKIYKKFTIFPAHNPNSLRIS